VSANKNEFDELYRLEHEAHFTQARTEREVDALVTALELRPAERVLDLGCGWGRHLRELKRRGFSNLVGVDVQGAFLEPIQGVVLLERDAADLGFGAEFDAVYCAFNALFATADDAPRVLQAVSQALKPGGRFLLDTTNRERLATAQTPLRSWRGGGELPWLLEETHFDLATGAQPIAQRHIFSGGHTETRTLTRYHYTLAELGKLFRAAGLALTDVYGDWQLGPYTAQSPRLILVARKEA
jgi:SAM-dependent methyltransferase